MKIINKYNVEVYFLIQLYIMRIFHLSSPQNIGLYRFFPSTHNTRYSKKYFMS